jgi:hypothetical protein
VTSACLKSVKENQKPLDSELDRQASLRHMFSKLRSMSPAERAQTLRELGQDESAAYDEQREGIQPFKS